MQATQAPPQAAPRIRSYNVPHKALRNALAQFSMMAGNTDYSDPAQAGRLKAFGSEVFFLMDHHAHTENTHTLARLDVRAPGAAAHDLEDHERLEKTQKAFEARLAGLDGMQDAEFGHCLYLEFTKFHGEYLAHIYHEETETEAAIWQNFTDGELVQHRNQIMGAMPPQELMLWLKYGMPAFSHPERVGMLAGMKASAPAPAFQAVMGMLQSVLEEGEYRKLATALG